jgi:hypothetical protein
MWACVFVTVTSNNTASARQRKESHCLLVIKQYQYHRRFQAFRKCPVPLLCLLRDSYWFSCLAYSSILKMEVTFSSETSVDFDYKALYLRRQNSLALSLFDRHSLHSTVCMSHYKTMDKIIQRCVSL